MSERCSGHHRPARRHRARIAPRCHSRTAPAGAGARAEELSCAVRACELRRMSRRTKGSQLQPLSPVCMLSRRRATSIDRKLGRRRGPIVAALDAEIARGRTQGPYGSYPAGPLSRENSAGLIYRVSDDGRRSLGARLAAALEHVHLLVFRPRDADPAALQALLDAGWSTNDIVTLSQFVAFLSFQIRAVGGLRTLAAAPVRSMIRRNAMTDAVITHADNKEPTAFTQKELGWLPWLEPLAEGDFTERHRAALVDASAHQVALFPPAGARSRHSRSAHQDR